MCNCKKSKLDEEKLKDLAETPDRDKDETPKEKD